MTGLHNHWLVLLSVIVATMASFVALVMAIRVAPSQQPQRQWLSLAVGVLAIGSGIWTMHFIGMLGFQLPVPVSYDIWLTLLSLILAVAGSGFSLAMAARDPVGPGKLIGAGTLIGIAIVSMHYTGMAAMRMVPPIRYDLPLVALSILIAVAASVLALWNAGRLRIESLSSAFWQRAGSAVLQGSAIYGMHYTGMAAASFGDGVADALIESCVLGRSGVVEHLTPREREVVRLVAEGKSNAEAAATLGLSPRSVETYRLRLMQKLGLDGLPSLVKFAIRHGITTLE